MMQIHVFPSGPFSTNAIVVACEKTAKAAIVDPSPGSFSSIVACIERLHLQPEKILLTHSHWDHTADVAVLKKKYKIPVFVSAKDAGNLEKPGTDGVPLLMSIEGVIPDGFLAEGDSITVGEIQFRVIETPGHTPGCLCFYSKENELLLSGDTLFKGTIGNLSLSTARPQLMWDSLAKLAKLPPETRVIPGHGEETTIGNERWLARAEELFGDSF